MIASTENRLRRTEGAIADLARRIKIKVRRDEPVDFHLKQLDAFRREAAALRCTLDQNART